MTEIAASAGEQPLVAFISGRIAVETKWARDVVEEVLRVPTLITPWRFESTPASSERLEESYLNRVRAADLLVWLIEESTTPPVQSEILAALEARRPILMFRLVTAVSDRETEDLINAVHTKWTVVIDATDLRMKLRVALNDELCRAFRAVGRSDHTAMLSLLAAESRARCLERWLGSGVDESLAERFAADPSIGASRDPVLDRPGFHILCGEIGSGKSLAAERLFVAALDRLRKGNEQPPVFIQATSLTGGFDRAIASARARRDLTPASSSLIVIDGLDEVSSDHWVGLLRAARTLARVLPLLRVVVTTRPFPELNDGFSDAVIMVKPLLLDDALALAARVSGSDIYRNDRSGWSESLRDAIRRPLFAVLLGVYYRSRPPYAVSQARLIANLVESALGRVDARTESAEPLLRKLACAVLDGGGAPAPLSDVASYAQAAPLLRSRLIVEHDRTAAFALAILTEWFGAQSLAAGAPSTGELVQTSGRLERWRMPLLVGAGQANEEALSRLLGPVVSERPGFATQLLHVAFPPVVMGSPVVPLPPWRELGARMQLAMTCWAEGLSTLAPQIAPVDSEGHVCSAAGLVEGSAAVTSWAGHRLAAAVMDLPKDSFEPSGWEHRLVRRGGSGTPALAWQWTLDEIRWALKERLERRTLSLPTALEPEFVWRVARYLSRHYVRNQDGTLPRERICRLLGELPQKGDCGDGVKHFRLEDVHRTVGAFLAEYPGADFKAPFPEADQRAHGWTWTGYSPQAMLARTIAVYTAGLEAYVEIANRWFPKFIPDLALASMQPFRFVGVIRTSDDEAGRPGIHFFVVPAERLTIDISIHPKETATAAMQQLTARFETDLADVSASLLDVFAENSAEDLAYGWLQRDLRIIHWY